MPFFRRPDYQSDTTQFLSDLHQQKPDLLQRQLQGRSLLWDAKADAEVNQQYQKARIAQQAYVYQTHGN